MFACRLVAFAASLAAIGCGGNDLYPVSGRVAYPDGTPLGTGRVVLDTGNGPVGTWGLIRPDGTFQMGTHAPDDGVPPGTWRVYIENAVTAPPPGHAGNFVSRPLIDPRFADPATSGLTFDVPQQADWQIVVRKP